MIEKNDDIRLNKSAIVVSTGTPDAYRDCAARLYDVAFKSKLALAVPDKHRRITMLRNGLMLEHSIAATDCDKLVGIAGFSTSEGALTSRISYKSLLADLGLIGGNRAALVLSFYERTARSGELLMDGIVVDAEYRGRGIGTALFAQLIEYATTQGYAAIRLDVIDTNPAAQRLYERLGFVAEKTERFEFLRRLIGFGASTTMVYTLADP